MRKGRRKKKSRVSYLVFLILAISVATGIFFYDKKLPNHPPLTKAFILDRTWRNYNQEIQTLSKEFDLPAEYFLALIVLECSGEKQEDITPRFEEHVFQRLKDVRDKDSKNYGSIAYNTIHDSSDDALKNLATSWGPFQLMGYQCIELDVNVADIRGDKSLYWGIYWINRRYGKYLKQRDFKNAFHIHNAGHPYPLLGGPNTHNPQYVQNGISYIAYFKKKLAK